MRNPGPRNFQVLVVGGGPAGCAAAIKLREFGVSVALFERTSYDRPRIGETLPPEAGNLLRELGVWERFISDGPIESPGNISVWGSDVPVERDFCFGPYGPGWHIDRAAFDRMLAGSAQERGVETLTNFHVKSYERTPTGRWLVSGLCGERPVDYEGDYLLLATGRSACQGPESQERKVIDRLIGAVRFLDLNGRSQALDHRTVVESDEDGWWYSSVLPQEQLVIAYMTDADLVSRRRHWFGPADSVRSMRIPSFTLKRIKQCVWSPQVSFHAANTSVHLNPNGPNWCAVGDLHACLDPLSSQGISNALRSGLQAAPQVVEVLKHPLSAPAEYIPSPSAFRRFLREKEGIYNMEKRWPNSTFWTRRHSRNLGGSPFIPTDDSHDSNSGLK